MNSYEKYWEETLSEAFEGAGAYELYSQLTPEQRESIAKSLRISEECKSLAFYTPPASDRYNEIEREYKAKIKALEEQSRKQYEQLTNALGSVLKLDPAKLSLNRDGGIDYTCGRSYEVVSP